MKKRTLVLLVISGLLIQSCATQKFAGQYTTNGCMGRKSGLVGYK